MLVTEQPHGVEDLLEQLLDQGVDLGGSLVLVLWETAVLQVTFLEGKPVVHKETEKDEVPAEIPLCLKKRGVFLCQVLEGEIVLVRANPLTEKEQEDAANLVAFQERRQGCTKFSSVRMAATSEEMIPVFVGTTTR
jgi:hypothetical protein